MPLFWKREKAVKELIEQYFGICDEAITEFRAALNCYLDEGACEKYSYHDQRIHQAESKADDLRVEIEEMMYRRGLLPESRGDILGLLENFDRIPNLAEHITFIIDTQNIVIPDEFRARFVELLRINLEAYRAVRVAVDALFNSPDKVTEVIKPVDEKESESDDLERELITAIFKADIDNHQMPMLRDLVTLISDISDAAERVSHRLRIISLKRRI